MVPQKFTAKFTDVSEPKATPRPSGTGCLFIWDDMGQNSVPQGLDG